MEVQVVLLSGGVRGGWAGLTARWHGVPLHGIQLLGRRAAAGARVGRGGRRGKRTEVELATRAARELCKSKKTNIYN